MNNSYIKYRLADIYEDICGETVGTFDTVEEATEAARSYDAETDGECDLVLIGFTATDDFKLIREWEY